MKRIYNHIHNLYYLAGFWIIIIIAMTSGICLAQDAQLTQVINNLFSSVEQGKPEEIIPLLTPETAKNVRKISRYHWQKPRREDLNNLVGAAGGVKEGLLKVNIKNLSIKITEKGGDTAKIRVTYSFEENEGIKKPAQNRKCLIYMKLVEGKWLIDKLNNEMGG